MSDATPLACGSFTTTSPGQTQALGRALGERLEAGDVLALIGELGSGKTRFVKGVARGLGVPDAERAVTSPTFVLLAVHRGGRETLYHFDVYRLPGPAAFEHLEGGDFLGASGIRRDGGVAVVEWADRVSGCLPAEALEIVFEIAGEIERRITMTGNAGRWGTLVQVLRLDHGP